MIEQQIVTVPEAIQPIPVEAADVINEPDQINQEPAQDIFVDTAGGL
jgi:hypothetical protein